MISANCQGCGLIVEADSEGKPSRDKFHLHFVGKCPGCGNTTQWHHTVSGLVGQAPMLSLAKSCPPSCKYHDRLAKPPARR